MAELSSNERSLLALSEDSARVAGMVCACLAVHCAVDAGYCAAEGRSS